MNDNDTNEKPYALTCDPPCYTEQEMNTIRFELDQAHETIKTLRTDFNNYRAMMQDRAWKAQGIFLGIDRNVQAAEQLHFLVGNSATFMEGYNNARVAEVLFLLTEDNIAKLKELKESQEGFSQS